MIETQPFGRTGHPSTRVIFGAAALGAMRQDRADRTLETVRRHGVNHIDVAASYGDAEVLLAPFLADHRDEVLLATKTGERTGDRARRELEATLEVASSPPLAVPSDESMGRDVVEHQMAPLFDGGELERI
jgi:aryl-alcohol dehydrogenase-like predicted oxidoreductase